MPLCMTEGFITGCAPGTEATRLVRAVEDERMHPFCDSCAIELASGLGPVIIETIPEAT